MAGTKVHPPCVGRAEAVRLFVSETPLNAVMVDLNSRIVAASPEFCTYAPFGPDQIQGLHLSQMFNGAQAGLEQAHAALTRNADGYSGKRDIVLPDGRLKHFRSEASAWRNDAGEIGGYMFIMHDVTAEHEAESRRREMEELLRAVVDNIPATLAVLDIETGEFALMNDRAREALEFNACGSSPGDDRTAELRERLLKSIEGEAFEASGGVQLDEYSVLSGGLAGRTLRLKRLAFRDSRGRRRLLSVGEDVTDLRDATRALEEALSQAERANDAKTTFLATMSHEIRTPLNGVLGMVQAMGRDELSEVQRRRLEIVRKSGEALLAIVNDALDIAKIEAGKLDLEEIDFDLAELIEMAAAGFEAMASSKGLGLVVDLRAAAGVYRGDPTRLRQVISNLISNAVKFTAEGEVRVSAAQRREGLVVTVADTGPGMGPEVLGRLFQKFVQADASTTRQFGGTGLGLAICRELAELMGGEIRAESRLGEGSRFIVTLPLQRVGDAGERELPQAAPMAEVSDQLRVLAADDNPINREVLKAIFDQVGVGVTLAEDGGAVLEAYRAEGWDVILMDAQMPVMDGLTATRRIREIEQQTGRARTPIIALTADAMEHQRAQLVASGMDAVVTKPLEIGALFAAIERVVAGEADAAVSAAGA